MKHYPLIPLLDRDFTSEGESHYVTPHVIVGCLDNQTGEFIENPNYNLYFDPSGLRYTEEQITFLQKYNQPLYDDATLWRATAPREILEESDKKNNIFAEAVAYYQNEQPKELGLTQQKCII